MSVADSLLAYSFAALLLTLTPGLDTALILRTATVEGGKKAFQAALGIDTGCFIWGAAVAFGLGALLAASEDIGMLISDLMLPGQMSGAEVINFARQHYPHLPLLLISGQDLRPAHNPALPDVELLRKPFTRVQLAQALRRIAA